MNALFRDPSLQLIGLTLIHFLWQGALIAAALAVVLRSLRGASARWRHNASVLSLGLLMLAPLATWTILQSPGSQFDAPSSPDQTATRSSLQPSVVRSPGVAGQGNGDALGFVVGGWVIGVGVFAFRLMGGWWQILRWLRREASPVDPHWQERLSELGRRLQIRRSIRLLETHRVSGPVVFGWLRPVILIPMGMLAGLPSIQIEALLLHELAHIRHHDFLINLLQRLTETLLFYHPAVWWVSEQIRRERELRCDDLVVATLGESRPLAEALLVLAEGNGALPAMALAAQGGGVAMRIRRLLGGAPDAAPRMGRRIFWIVAAVGLIATGLWVAPIFTAPKLYQSGVIFMEMPPKDVGRTVSLSAPPTLEAKFKCDEAITLVRGGVITSKVIQKLALREKWGLPDDRQLLAKFQSRLHVQTFGTSATVRVVVADEDPKIAAEMANDLATSFLEYQRRREEARVARQQDEFRRQIERVDSLLDQAIDRVAVFAAKNAAVLNERGILERHKVLTDDVDKLREVRQQKRQAMVTAQIEDQPSQHWAIVDLASPATRPTRWYAGNN